MKFGDKLQNSLKSLGKKITLGSRWLGQKLWDNKYKIAGGLLSVAAVSTLPIKHQVLESTAGLRQRYNARQEYNQLVNTLPFGRSQDPYVQNELSRLQRVSQGIGNIDYFPSRS